MKDLLKWVTYGGIFIVPFLVLLVTDSLFFPFITGKNFAFRIIVEIIFAAWILLALYEPQYRPKFSWIFAAFGGLIIVMFFANLFGEYAPKSFWSNFERMDGYVTLIHVFGYFIVVGSMVVTEKLWNKLFNATLIAATLLSLYSLAQLSGQITINQGGWRLDGTLGNAAYMAVYMLFHVFIALLMSVRTQSKQMKALYAFLAAAFVFFLIQTATRGTILGLTGGLLVTTLYIALFAKGMPNVRKATGGALLALVVLIGLFITFKDSSFIQNDARLNRVANITLSEASTRFEIWSMALEGVKERPILGWGQENFNYVFNKYYTPELYGQEPWFDRVHNIVLDWLIAGGIVGAFFYFSIIGAVLWYLLVRPLVRKETPFSVLERGVLIGLIAGYVFHNLFVFDNLISYIFFAIIIAYIHSRSSQVIARVQAVRVQEHTVTHVAAPIVVVIALGVVWIVNVPALMTAGDVLEALSITSPNDPNAQLLTEETAQLRLAAFKKALAHDSFGNQEVREQLSMQALALIRSTNVTEETRQEIFKTAENALLAGVTEKPGDARLHIFTASFYRVTGNPDAALEQVALAREVAPQKQQIMFEEGMILIQQEKYSEALAVFENAYTLAPEFMTARILYAAAAIYAGHDDIFRTLITTDEDMQVFAQNTTAIQAAYAVKNYNLLVELFETQVALESTNPQLRINLALAYYQSGNRSAAIAELRELVTENPAYAESVAPVIQNMQNGTFTLE